MRILLVSDYFQPKIGYTKVQISREFIKLGHKVAILTSDRYFPFHNYEATAKKLLGSRIRAVGIKNENGFRVERRPILFEFLTRVFIPDLKSSIKNLKPNLVIVVGISSFTCFQTAMLKKELGFRLHIVDSHLPSEFNSGNILLKKIFYFLFRLFFSKAISNFADRVIAIQDKTVEVIKDIYGIKNNIEVIPNGTDIDLFTFSKKERVKIRQELKISPFDFVIIYTGKIIKQKGVDILFSAFGKLATKNMGIYLILVGDGPKEYLDSCYAKVSKEKHKNIHLVGFKDQKELFKYYSASDVAVWPLQESLAMNDAASCSLPFIANETMGDKTRISNNNALLYKQGSVLDLTKQIKKLMTNNKLRDQMGRNGRNLMVRELSWKEIAKRFL